MSRLSFSAMACIVIAAILGLAAFSNVLAQVGSGAGGSSVICGGSGNSAVVPCPDPIKQGPAGVSQAAALGSLNLTTSSNHSINASVRSHLFDLRAGARGVNLSGLSLDKTAGGAPLGAVTSLASPPEWGGGASADSSSVPSKLGFFANGQGSFGDQDATSREPGFDFHTAGASVGGDYRFTDRFISGLAFGYLRTNADFHSSAGDFTSDAYSLSAYGTYYVLDKLYVDGIVTYGWNTYDTERNVANTGKAKGSTAGTHVSPGVSAGYNFNSGAFTFGPTGRVEYLRVDINAFREHGADPFNLSIRSQKIESVTTALGGRLTYAIATPWAVLLPLVRSEWVHEYKGDSLLFPVLFSRSRPPARTGTTAILARASRRLSSLECQPSPTMKPSLEGPISPTTRFTRGCGSSSSGTRAELAKRTPSGTREAR